MKRVLALFLCVVFFFNLYAESSDVRVFFPSLDKKPIYPVDSDLGQCAVDNATDEYVMLKRAFAEKYGVEWAEKYIHASVRRNFVSVYSALFSDLLPESEVMFSKARINSDGSMVITAKFPEKNKLVSFAVKDNLIFAILE